MRFQKSDTFVGAYFMVKNDIAVIHYDDIPLNGTMSDLTARFFVYKVNDDEFTLAFIDLHVMQRWLLLHCFQIYHTLLIFQHKKVTDSEKLKSATYMS